ncbi:tRNA 2'-phosphotransferase 1 isoform X3 [Gracilinanus agilis]|uniref:tRNA 2'-phosphotransferase 1 isoform X3 n=1 Tax=Gracilinanus agilis TaxID=191870 RepID=UPI001CFEEBB8|nr:tRNA 2'-phosphotransferase 1 isoform X3 [Gracilinanus agilis]
MNPAGGQTSQQAGPWGRRTRRPSAQVRAQGSSVGAGGPPRSSAGAVGPSAGDGGAGDAPPPGAGDFPGNSGLERDQHPRVLGLFQERDVRLSKALSYALRHGAVKMGLPMGSDGFVPLDALLQLPQFRGFSEEDVCRVVETNEKQRFALRPGAPGACACIRANQGHSLQLADLELTPLRTPQDLPPVLVHGTYWRHWPSIRQEGLSRCGRTHIHLSPGLPGEPHVLSGMRQNCEVAVFIDGPSALAGRPLSLAEEETEGQSGPQGASANSRRKNIRSVQP